MRIGPVGPELRRCSTQAHIVCVLATAALTLGAGALVPAETVELKSGERITGRVTRPAAKEVRVETPFGPLTIPRDKIARILRDDGTEEPALAATPSPTPAPVSPQVTPAPAGVKIRLLVSGQVFWQAWERRGAPQDPSLRFELRVDGQTVAAWQDAQLDQGEIPGAVVNAFSFAPNDVDTGVRDDVVIGPSEVSPGKIQLEVSLPKEYAGVRQVTLAYRANAGSTSAPKWQDLVKTSIHVELSPDAPTLIHVIQGRGEMEFSGLLSKRMRKVDTFGMTLRRE